MSLVSVIIPVYKTEKYLDQCIKSIAGQTYENLDIILVDDDSPDNCPKMCDEWAKRDKRITVIHKKNNGAGMARNTGLDHAKGRYVCFCDSDDYLELDAIEKEMRAMNATGADAVVFGFNKVDGKGNVLSTFVPQMGKDSYTGDDIQKEFLPELIAPDPKGDGERHLYMSNWLMLCSLDMIRDSGWKFDSEREIYSEDVYSLLALFMKVNHVVILSEALYHYRENDNSISRSYNPGRYERIRHFYLETVALGKQLGCTQNVIDRLCMPYISFTIAAMKQEANVEIPVAIRKNNLKRIIYDDVLQKALSNVREKKNVARVILYWAIRNKFVNVCYLCLFLQNLRKSLNIINIKQ